MKFHDMLLEVIHGFSIATSAGEIKNKKMLRTTWVLAKSETHLGGRQECPHRHSG